MITLIKANKHLEQALRILPSIKGFAEYRTTPNMAIERVMKDIIPKLKDAEVQLPKSGGSFDDLVENYNFLNLLRQDVDTEQNLRIEEVEGCAETLHNMIIINPYLILAECKHKLDTCTFPDTINLSHYMSDYKVLVDSANRGEFPEDPSDSKYTRVGGVTTAEMRDLYHSLVDLVDDILVDVSNGTEREGVDLFTIAELMFDLIDFMNVALIQEQYINIKDFHDVAAFEESHTRFLDSIKTLDKVIAMYPQEWKDMIDMEVLRFTYHPIHLQDSLVSIMNGENYSLSDEGYDASMRSVIHGYLETEKMAVLTKAGAMVSSTFVSILMSRMNTFSNGVNFNLLSMNTVVSEFNILKGFENKTFLETDVMEECSVLEVWLQGYILGAVGDTDIDNNRPFEQEIVSLETITDSIDTINEIIHVMGSDIIKYPNVIGACIKKLHFIINLYNREAENV